MALTGCDAKSDKTPKPTTKPAARKPTTTSRPVPEGPHPRIHADKPLFGLGKRWSTEPPVKHAFVLENVGKLPLKITGVSSSCGCTTIGKKQITLEPGETWDLEIELDLTQQKSLVAHKITVFSNDPVEPQYTLRIVGVVQRPIVLSPPNGMFFGKVGPEEKRTREIKITNKTDEAMDLSITRRAGDWLSAEIKPVKPGKEYTLVLRAKPPYKPGANTGRIEMKTGLTMQPEIAIRPQAFRPPPLMVSPQHLRLPTKLPNGARRVVSVRNNSDEPIKVTGATCSLDGVKIDISAVKGGKVHNLDVRFPADMEIPKGPHTLTIRTDDSAHPELEVLIYAMQQPAAMPVPPPPPE